MLAAAWVAVVVSGVAASPAQAAQGERVGVGQARDEAGTGLLPRSGQWWFSSWQILQRVWPLAAGAGVTVAVLDTGVQASVPDLRGAVLPGGDFAGGQTNGETDGNGHGTMMSVLIAGQGHGTGVVGVAPEAKILPVVVNATSDEVASDPAAIAAGIIYAASQGARVIEVSQEYPSVSASGCDEAVQAAVAYALARDSVVIAAAGDTDLIGTRPSEPASCAGVLAVSAVQPNGSLWPQDTRQPYISVASPGADLITSGRDGQLVTGVSGTSDASALAAGAVALIRSRYPTMPWYQVIQRVTATALAEGGHVPNDSFGYGFFQLSEAVDAAAYPVSASGPSPVYEKYQAWLTSPQGKSVVRQLSAAPAAKGVSDSPHFTGGEAMLAVAVALVVAAVGAAAFFAGKKRPPFSGQPSRVSGQPSRVSGQQARVSGEQAWVSGEQARMSGEPSRVSGQPSRVSGEQARNVPRKKQVSTTCPSSSSGQEYFPRSMLVDRDSADRYPPPGKPGPHRIPPYMPAQDFDEDPPNGVA